MSTLLDDMSTMIEALRRFKDELEKAMTYGTEAYSYDDICNRVLRGDVDTYILPNSLVLMELAKYPQGTTYHCFVAVGDMDEIIDFEHTAMREARLRNASMLSIAGRHGWERVLTKHGWKRSLVIMQKEVLHEQDIAEDPDTRDRSADEGGERSFDEPEPVSSTDDGTRGQVPRQHSSGFH